MNKQEKCGYWLMLSDYDLGTIDALIQGERWVYVAYLCQQAMERQLKGMYVYFLEDGTAQDAQREFSLFQDRRE